MDETDEACCVCGDRAPTVMLIYRSGPLCLRCAREWKAEAAASESRHGAGKDHVKEKDMPKKKKATA